jgi:hypothetical protein
MSRALSCFWREKKSHAAQDAMVTVHSGLKSEVCQPKEL